MQGATQLVILLTLLTMKAVCFYIDANQYVGRFADDDIIVAHYFIFKEARPFTRAKAEYGRAFPCVISYYAIVDKTKDNPLPSWKTVRGGLGQNFLSLILSAPIGKALSVNVYVGCHNTKKAESQLEKNKKLFRKRG